MSVDISHVRVALINVCCTHQHLYIHMHQVQTHIFWYFGLPWNGREGIIRILWLVNSNKLPPPISTTKAPTNRETVCLNLAPSLIFIGHSHLSLPSHFMVVWSVHLKTHTSTHSSPLNSQLHPRVVVTEYIEADASEAAGTPTTNPQNFNFNPRLFFGYLNFLYKFVHILCLSCATEHSKWETGIKSSFPHV